MRLAHSDKSETTLFFRKVDLLTFCKVTVEWWKRSIPKDCSDWNVVGGTFVDLAAALIVDLRGGDMAVAEQFLHLANVFAGFEQNGGGGGS